jgi:hypothetical protein
VSKLFRKVMESIGKLEDSVNTAPTSPHQRI